ncbi:MAG TPA: glycerate kinase [Candidatus Limnocylindria bacterium]|nr:glycerate kinase [Candidatus Limnocylindria bacterium]
MPTRSLTVVVAPDSFGGALDSVGVAAAIAAGWARVRPDDEILRRPMADGGEGTLAAIADALGDAAERRTADTTDALGRPITADWLLLDGGRTAFVEMAAASGLARLPPDERTPESARRASTRGTGTLIRAARGAGVERITIGLGGSATTDGGSGLVRELGVVVRDRDGNELPDGGAALASIGSVDASSLDPRLASTEIVVASDVTNPLCGPRGAAATYGPQKGADPATVEELDAALAAWGKAIERATGRLVADLPGAGAAGGTTAGLLGFTRAVVRPGVEVVAELIGLAEALEQADLVITGEGRADEQTLQGKTAMGIASLARPRGTPVALLCGSLGERAEALDGATAIAVVQPILDRPMDLPTAMADTERLLVAAAGRLARSIGIGMELARP